MAGQRGRRTWPTAAAPRRQPGTGPIHRRLFPSTVQHFPPPYVAAKVVVRRQSSPLLRRVGRQAKRRRAEPVRDPLPPGRRHRRGQGGQHDERGAGDLSRVLEAAEAGEERQEGRRVLARRGRGSRGSVRAQRLWDWQDGVRTQSTVSWQRIHLLFFFFLFRWSVSIFIIKLICEASTTW